MTPPVAPPRARVGERPARLFVLTWDNSRSRANPSERDLEKRRCLGVYWPGEPYQVALSTGHSFESLSDLRAAFALGGDYDLAWLDGRAEEQA